MTTALTPRQISAEVNAIFASTNRTLTPRNRGDMDSHVPDVPEQEIPEFAHALVSDDEFVDQDEGYADYAMANLESDEESLEIPDAEDRARVWHTACDWATETGGNRRIDRTQGLENDLPPYNGPRIQVFQAVRGESNAQIPTAIFGERDRKGQFVLKTNWKRANLVADIARMTVLTGPADHPVVEAAMHAANTEIRETVKVS